MKKSTIKAAIAVAAIASCVHPAKAATNYDAYGNSIGNSTEYYRNGAGIATPVSPGSPLPVIAPGAAVVTQIGTTIAATNTFQQILPANPSRAGCLIQNQGIHVGYVYAGTGTPTLTNSFIIAAGGTFACTNLQSAIQWAGTAGDALIISEAQ